MWEPRRLTILWASTAVTEIALPFTFIILLYYYNYLHFNRDWNGSESDNVSTKAKRVTFIVIAFTVAEMRQISWDGESPLTRKVRSGQVPRS
jgi:hypothetical protein